MPANARSHAVLTTESKVTIRGQTTIPAPVREALKLKPGQDSIHYEILPGGQVFMCRLGDEQEDHTMNAFLRFLDADIQNNPQKTRPFNIQHSTFNIQHSTFNIQHSTFNIQHSTFNKERNLSLAWTSTLMMRLATTNNGFSTKG
ncbi:TPA: type II toxin-antitoxin system PrlF family antitoxin [Escherichia coli]|nr:type II toxin-antitoxin system PrlF family antitoxin [Escherichia coli]EIT7434490.1 type II toxin-antitoxin system PrlF family antitoxin [Escherichia coli]EIX5050084.1 type II toxin-antitoxin system PrlF family antitoxin [Escherichia coli]EJN4061595.1 type II toxin-antitoxin system PrlF family antitoxin [Escherichia coli]EKC4252147.1 type II toxin-antitoxin system PrlF family antitoxin [Escherichia coli]